MSNSSHPPAAKKRRLNPGWIVLAVGLVFIAVLAAARWAYSENRPPSQLADAQKACVVNDPAVVLADDGHTLTVDSRGTDEVLSANGGIGPGTLTCILDALGTPEAVRQHMAETRALDGRQFDVWGDYTASWSFHPDDGLDLIVRVQ